MVGFKEDLAPIILWTESIFFYFLPPSFMWKELMSLKIKKRDGPLGVGFILYSSGFFTMSKILESCFKSQLPWNILEMCVCACARACVCNERNRHRGRGWMGSTFHPVTARGTEICFSVLFYVLTPSQDCQREEFYTKYFEKPQIGRMISVDQNRMGYIVCD